MERKINCMVCGSTDTDNLTTVEIARYSGDLKSRGYFHICDKCERRLLNTIVGHALNAGSFIIDFLEMLHFESMDKKSEPELVYEQLFGPTEN